jgi:phage shock protein PspC (stress-responsive transcriptional regulator)
MRREGVRLRLSGTERKIAGVCGGLGEYFELDPVLFRAAFVVLAFAGGLGILLYLALWLVVPGPVPAPRA